MANRSINVPPEGGNYRIVEERSPSSPPVASAFYVVSAFRRKMTAIAISLTIGATVLAQVPSDRQAAEALARRAAQRMAALQREADALANQARSLLVELRKLELDREMKVEQLAEIRRETAEVQSKLAASAART